MKLLTRTQYEKLSPVKRDVYEKRVRKYYGIRNMALATEPWIEEPNKPSVMIFRDSYTGRTISMRTKDFLDANETAARILLDAEEITIDEAIARLRKEVGP